MKKNLATSMLFISVLGFSMPAIADHHWGGYQASKGQNRGGFTKQSQWGNSGNTFKGRQLSNYSQNIPLHQRNNPDSTNHLNTWNQSNLNSRSHVKGYESNNRNIYVGRYDHPQKYNNNYGQANRVVVYRAGDRLPDIYRSSRYYINDYHRYDLYEPPHGYHWVNIDGNYILVALATGIISQIFFGGYTY
ncbi:RcnB family protein [Acinetobacter stercoris]|uniref:RcnB family protein n=1 Tax=Acinetobacter stercoris TaxID=2126983 RepID=A0A2U3N1W8_9GAMM|nr:RcnB family protein [Acinetobacter stercoris]SPL71658.1 hypothetical protein KPC_2836 [Acinetobacter stercoris]